MCALDLVELLLLALDIREYLLALLLRLFDLAIELL
jgi:hypothetical protein